MNGHPEALFYPYSLFKKFLEAYNKVRDDLLKEKKNLIAMCARASQYKEEDFKKFLES